MSTFELHFSEAEAGASLATLDPQRLSTLRLGAASAGYQCEGGFNGPGEPRNNWAEWEGRAGVVPSGGACRFWEHYAEDAQMLADAGLDTFRLSVEWARVQPCFDVTRNVEPALDAKAIAHYADIIDAFGKVGVETMITLYHWTHPQNLGSDFWLSPDSPARFAAYVRSMLPRLLEALSKRGARLPSRYITINEPNMFAMATYVAGRFPHGPGQQGGRTARSALENLLLAHLEGARAVRAVYREVGLSAPPISFNNNFSAFYRADAFFVDLLHAPLAKVPRRHLEAYLRGREERFTKEFLASEGEIPVPRQVVRWAVRGLEGLLRQGVRLERLTRLIDAVYALEGPAVDYLAFDYYDPFPWNLLGRSTPGNDRGPGPVVDEWDWKPHPKGLSVALELYAQAAPGLPIWVAENGMATRGVGPRAYPRRDGTRRDLFIKAHLYEWLRALTLGVPIEGYLHWSLWDNYEWGSYQPRFGLIGVDSVGNRLERTAMDAAGFPSLASYGAIARAVRAGNIGKLVEALSAREVPTLRSGQGAA
jgi:beta-glucosidase/6-phospho-beta-glucosidase/beta-galactosidase